ncbi:MAG: nucleotide exchange factor GrpE [Bacteroidales bacterium]|nr:nucleotide exchange factor GrpE [Bacteroidales bacterium]
MSDTEEIKEENKEAENAAEETVTEQDSAAAAAEEPVDECAKLQAEIEQQKDKYLRLSAEYDNYRKRTLKEKLELSNNAKIDIIKAMLPVIDDFERALAHMDEATEATSHREGVELIYKKFIDFLGKQGVEAIEAKGQDFNTDMHEAITKLPAPSEDMKGKVLDCVEKGYKLNDKVIRFSKVVVCE